MKKKADKLMNSRKIKLELAVNLINEGNTSNLLDKIKGIMASFKEEVGNFLGLKVIKKSKINTFHEKESYAIEFENCTLDVELLNDQTTSSQYVQSFDLR